MVESGEGLEQHNTTLGTIQAVAKEDLVTYHKHDLSFDVVKLLLRL